MSSRMDYRAASPEGIRALAEVHRYVRESGLPKALLDLVFLRVSQINGCAHCIGMHSGDLLWGGIAIEKLVLVGSWREAGELFDTSERAALAWAESVTRVADTKVPDADYEDAASVFDQKQLADLTIAIATINAYNRLAISFRVPPTAARQRPPEIAHLP